MSSEFFEKQNAKLLGEKLKQLSEYEFHLNFDELNYAQMPTKSRPIYYKFVTSLLLVAVLFAVFEFSNQSLLNQNQRHLNALIEESQKYENQLSNLKMPNTHFAYTSNLIELESIDTQLVKLYAHGSSSKDLIPLWDQRNKLLRNTLTINSDKTNTITL